MNLFVVTSSILCLLCIIGLLLLVMLVQFMLGMIRVPMLEDWPAQLSVNREEEVDGHAEPWPSVTVIIPARNEERHIRQALTSLRELDYPNLKILTIDDRSTDRTTEVLEELRLHDSRIMNLRVDSLPDHWLGKNHAIQCGIERTESDLILLTDADVHFAPQSLRRSVGFLVRNNLDHLVIGPRVEMHSWMLQGFTLMFVLVFATVKRPWKACDPKSKASVGVGGFGLFRTSVLKEVGGMTRIALRPDDDLMLGKLVKQSGYSQLFAFSASEIFVPWYASVRELIVGLEKNTFAVVNYNPFVALIGVAFMFVFYLFPWLCILAVPLVWVWLPLTVSLLPCLVLLLIAIRSGYRWSSAFALPLVTILMCYIHLRSMFLVYIRGGIRWRDTLYPLAELKRCRL